MSHIWKASSKRPRSIFPMSMRSPFVPQYLGGSEGYRGGDWRSSRLKALIRSDFRSQISGFPANVEAVQVDHIYPYRIGGSNKLSNLRVVGFKDNPFIDNAKGFEERLTEPKKQLKRITK